MLTASSSTATIIQYPSPPRSEQPKYNRRAWLKQIKVDPTLRPSVFKTSYEIAEYANAETGEFFVSAKTIAEGGDWSDGIAMSASTCEADIGKLEAAGHVECIERGKRGRGHSSRFRIVLKSQRTGISKPAKIPVSPPENPSLAPLKSQPAGMNLREPIEPSKSAAPPRSSGYEDRVVTDGDRDRAYGALKGTEYLLPDQDRVCRKMFDKLLADGFEPADLEESRATDFPGQTMSTWLPAFYKSRYPNWRMPQS